MTLNGNLAGYAVKGMLALLIGVSGWIVTKVERHESRIQSAELVNMRVETKLNYLIKGMDELKDEIKGKP